MQMNEWDAVHHAAALATRGVRGPQPRVLFVGAAPTQPCAQQLARDGLSCLVVEPQPALIERAGAYGPDIVLLQTAAPLAERIALLYAVRANVGCAVVLLAPEAGATEELIALEAGFDGVWSGPLDERLLSARLRAELRRQRRPERAGAARAAYGGLMVDRAAALVAYAGRPIECTRAQREALYLLALRQGRAVGRGELQAACPPRGGRLPEARAVDTMISRLRERLAAAGVEGLAIRAVQGHGYRLETRTPGAAAGERARVAQAVEEEVALAA
ncbi:MAG: DNA-binding response regulator [Betaproteobacteria bacterium]|jgi:DNA-binding response OmpR family regulator|nr:MAG: DNA-binding response regulator [Betaproteobacteria bacterium]